MDCSEAWPGVEPPRWDLEVWLSWSLRKWGGDPAWGRGLNLTRDKAGAWQGRGGTCGPGWNEDPVPVGV